jgi:acetylornithine deacetylase/succinyl-diaminopimelate desuccinylase-like protein
MTAATDEVVDLCRDLIRIDTTNTGDPVTVKGERVAAEYAAAKLNDVGLATTLVESAPGRANVVTRIAGADPSRGALLVHGHLDVVPAEAAEWSVDPFGGEIRDGYLWGRGAVDMKDFDAMMLAVARDWRRSGYTPPRDVVFAFTADEEAGSTWGAHYLVDKHPGLFEGVTEAIGEVGGYSVTVADQRLYLLQTAERGIAWLRLTAQGTAGHGAMVHPDNAVTELAEAVARIGRHQWPIRLTPPVRAFLEAAAEALGIEFDPDDPDGVLNRIGPIARVIRAVTRNTVNPTRLRAGYKVNVIPQEAVAEIDGRYLPGYEEEFFAQLDQLIGPKLARDVIHRDVAVETPAEGELYQAMTDALLAADPGARVVPYTMFGGTDAKAFCELGIRCFGFAPLQLPADLDFSGMFHGIDERVPVDGLRFGTRVLDAFLDHC